MLPRMWIGYKIYTCIERSLRKVGLMLAYRLGVMTSTTTRILIWDDRYQHYKYNLMKNYSYIIIYDLKATWGIFDLICNNIVYLIYVDISNGK